mmetsp:Transcript_16048/g.27065  ORF Transcript_16048/g.27065 Transcript_16048/m.27065 type:complete len:90 (-) Transcript_16048:1244-1513(-)
MEGWWSEFLAPSCQNEAQSESGYPSKHEMSLSHDEKGQLPVNYEQANKNLYNDSEYSAKLEPKNNNAALNLSQDFQSDEDADLMGMDCE